MNSAIVRSPRAAKPAVSVVFADLQKRDMKKRVTASDEDLLRRWERIAKETGRD
ncbi:MAG TPA: hypothetical protein VLE97_07155 [Gaiellaceae bacterium]|nr:hypothetical protein [Gaiellaceae bacterium]